MSVTFRAVKAIPNDNASRDDATAISFDRTAAPLLTMAVGDLVVVEVSHRDPGTTISNSNAGGQTWYPLATVASGSQQLRRFWCSFNGTWASDPAFDVNVRLGVKFSAIMRVFRPSGLPTWAVDQAQINGYLAPGSAPYDVTATGQDPDGATSVTLASWFNTSYAGEPFALQTAGWSNDGSAAQFRNQSGSSSDMTISTAYKLNASDVATGNVVNRITQTITTLWSVVTFKDQSAAAYPSLSSVDGDDVVATDATSIPIAGANLGSPTGTVTITQGAVSIAQPVSAWGASSITLSSLTLSSGGGNIEHGAATLRATLPGGAYAERAILIVPPIGQLYVLITSVHPVEAERLVVLPNLVAGCRIWACGLDFGAAPAGLYINPDATHGWTTGATEQPWLARVQDPDTGTYQPSWALQYYTDDPPDPDPGSGGGGAAVPPGRALRTPPMRIKWRRP